MASVSPRQGRFPFPQRGAFRYKTSRGDCLAGRDPRQRGHAAPTPGFCTGGRTPGFETPLHASIGSGHDGASREGPVNAPAGRRANDRAVRDHYVHRLRTPAVAYEDVEESLASR